MKKVTSYETGTIATNAVILTIASGKLLVYLNLRERMPFKCRYELPGGLLLPSETADENLTRKLQPIVGAKKIFFEQFYTFTKVKRDPRGRTIAIGYVALLPASSITLRDNFYDVLDLPLTAFDHKEIIGKAREYIKYHATVDLVKQLLPKAFPLNDLQSVYEIVLQTRFDNRNFRRKMLESGDIKKLPKKQTDVTHRPASLFSFV